MCPSWAAGSHASFTMGSRAGAWVGRASTLGQTAVPAPRNCVPSYVLPARAARCSAIEAGAAFGDERTNEAVRPAIE